MWAFGLGDKGYFFLKICHVIAIFYAIKWNSFFNKLSLSIADHKEQIDKAEEKERLQKEKEEKQKKEAEEKANEKQVKTNEEDTGIENEAEKHSDIEDNFAASIHEKIEVKEDSPVDQVRLYESF